MYRVLVLMSTYNGEQYVEEQVESIEKQKKVDISLLIRDDGSTDGTIALLMSLQRKYCNIEIIGGENKGCALSYGILFKEAHHRKHLWDFVAFADQDDVWLENKVYEGCLKLSHMSMIKPSMYCSNLTLADSKLQEIGDMYKDKPPFPKHPMQALIVNIATGCTMMVNKATIDMFNAHTPTQIRMHDSWIYQMCVLFGDVYFDNQSHILYRQHGNNVEGWTNNVIKRGIRKLQNINKFKNCSIECVATEMLNCYSSILSKEAIGALQEISTYRQTFKNRLNFVCRAHKYGIYREERFYNLILKVRIILGYL